MVTFGKLVAIAYANRERSDTMSDLVVRQIDFDVDQAKFIWNPDNPSFSVLMNQITFFVVGFEKYMCRVMRDAEAHITDAAVMEEAGLFASRKPSTLKNTCAMPGPS